MKNIVTIILLTVTAFIGFKGYTYYNDTYKATEAFSLVPSEVPPKEEALDMSGNKIANSDGTINYSYDYSFDFIKTNGKEQKQSFGLTGSDPIPYEPGTYVRAEISNKRVVKGPYKVAEKDIPKEIPKEILNKLQKQDPRNE